MRINVKVIPRAHENSVNKCDNGSYTVRITTVPEKGKANKAVQKLLAKHFNTSNSSVKIIYGATTRIKVVEIDKV